MVLWCDQCDDGVNRMEFPSENFRMQRIIVPRIALHITTVTTTVTTKVITFITTMMVVPSPLSSLPSSPLSGDLESYKKLSSSSTEDSFIGFLRRNFYNVKKSIPFLFFTRFLFSFSNIYMYSTLNDVCTKIFITCTASSMHPNGSFRRICSEDAIMIG